MQKFFYFRHCIGTGTYDCSLSESSNINRMSEAMKLYQSVCRNVWFENVPIITIFNKIDLFREKLTYSEVSQSWSEFKRRKTMIKC